MEFREGPLVEAFVRLADTLVADYDVVELCQELVESCTRLLDAAAAGLLLADHRGVLQVLASTSEETRLLELFQVEVHNGPGMLAYGDGGAVLVDDLTNDRRWPEFARQAVDLGYRGVYALPLRLRNERVGALNLFCGHPAALTHEDVRVGQALADVACIGILHHRVVARAETVNAQLQSALNSRIVIEQAKGVLAERGNLSMEQAFHLLRSHARATNQRLADLALAVVTGRAATTVILGPPLH